SNANNCRINTKAAKKLVVRFPAPFTHMYIGGEIMKKIVLLIVALGLCNLALAETEVVEVTTQHFTTGWDNFGEPLNLASSNVKWSVLSGRKMSVTFSLVGATPNKLYQVGVHIFCTTAPGTFGQFPTNPPSGNCGQITKQ